MKPTSTTTAFLAIGEMSEKRKALWQTFAPSTFARLLAGAAALDIEGRV